jgi:hypothetical protein
MFPPKLSKFLWCLELEVGGYIFGAITWFFYGVASISAGVTYIVLVILELFNPDYQGDIGEFE